jgi:nicotinate-nucleotide adenylyltransferase
MSDAGTGALGLFGGTFDPLHVAHLRLAMEARETLRLAQVCFIPAGNPALRAAPRASAVQRLAMVERALADAVGFAVDATEVLQPGAGPSYTVDTLERQRRMHGPQRPLVLLLGADAFSRLESWHRWRELFELAHIAVATRPGHGLPDDSAWAPTALAAELAARRGEAADLARAPAGRVVPFAITALEISSTTIRQRLERGLGVRYLVPDAVLDYIDSYQLYHTPHGH